LPQSEEDYDTEEDEDEDEDEDEPDLKNDTGLLNRQKSKLAEKYNIRKID